MKKLYSVFFVFAIVIFIAGCKKDDSTPTNQTSQYSDKITLGTGADLANFKITGESTSFTKIGGVATIYWRVESVIDVAGSAIQIKLEKSEGGSYVAYSTVSYPAAQSYGHITISSFPLKDAGTFKVTATIVNVNYTVASQVFTVQ